MRLPVLIVLAGLLLGGCVNQFAARQAYMAQFVGRPETDLVLSMGVPNRTYETGGVKYLAYEERRYDVIQGGPYWGPYWAWGPGFPAQVMSWVCETTVAVSDGIVRGFTLRGNACG
ncbi:MAG: hypothetical protein AB7F35_00080 [Acetobacteraceae bacterium]